MDSLREAQGQIRLAALILAVVIPIGVLGFMLLENLSLLDSMWLTIITLATIGYGDIYARTEGGRLFTLLLILFGLGTIAYALQATATFLVSPAIRELRARRRIQHNIDQLQHHYIICGVGELVEYTVASLMDAAQRRREYHQSEIYKPVDHFLDRIFGDDAHGHFPRTRAVLRAIFLFFVRLVHRSETLLDVIILITPDEAFANRLYLNGLLIIRGDPSSDDVLRRAGIMRAQALMVMLDSDTESLLAVLTARALNPNLEITAATLEEELAAKMVRVGANGVLAPYDIAGQFLNNATLRPAVNEFFTSILFGHHDIQTTQIELLESSPWIGKTLSDLDLQDRYNAAIVGLRRGDGTYLYAPNESTILEEDEILVIVVSGKQVPNLQDAARGSKVVKPRAATWQRLPLPDVPIIAPHRAYTLEEAEAAIAKMDGHFIISGLGRVARSATFKLDPVRPFVLISDDEKYTQELLTRGFRVIHGSPTKEAVLKKAGVQRASAMMVAIEDDAASVMTILNSRAMSKRLLITATAQSNEMIPKLQRAGADRVVSPLQVAAQFVLLATTRPAVMEFVRYITYNYTAGIETAELYMQSDSPWIGKTIGSLELERLFRAGVIGIRRANSHYSYAPSGNHILEEHEVLIVVTPMEYSDELRQIAHGSVNKRPLSLRRGYFEAQT